MNPLMMIDDVRIISLNDVRWQDIFDLYSNNSWGLLLKIRNSKCKSNVNLNGFTI